MIRAALFFASSLFIGVGSSSVAAETIDVEYSRFYSHVKKLDNEDTQALQFAFGFVRVGEGRLCEVNGASIVTDKKTMPLEVSDEGRFTVPTEKALKLANALVRIDLNERANVCDMSVQLETKPEYLKQYYTKDDLTFLYGQYEAFFNEMGSFGRNQTCPRQVLVSCVRFLFFFLYQKLCLSFLYYKFYQYCEPRTIR